MPRKKAHGHFEKQKIEFLTQLAIVMAVAAVAFSLSILLGLLITQSGSLQTAIVQQEESGTDDGRGVVPATPSTTIPSTTTSTGTSKPATGTTSSTATTTTQGKVTPAAGLPENIIILASVLLGIIGSATFVALKRGA